MRKTITITAFLLFIWLLLDVFHILDILINFILVGEIPGMQTSLSPTIMLAIVTTLSVIVIFELLARRIKVVWQIRQQLRKFIERRERLPRRRFNQI
jgi:hypothetical protein